MNWAGTSGQSKDKGPIVIYMLPRVWLVVLIIYSVYGENKMLYLERAHLPHLLQADLPIGRRRGKVPQGFQVIEASSVLEPQGLRASKSKCLPQPLCLY